MRNAVRRRPGSIPGPAKRRRRPGAPPGGQRGERPLPYGCLPLPCRRPCGRQPGGPWFLMLINEAQRETSSFQHRGLGSGAPGPEAEEEALCCRYNAGSRILSSRSLSLQKTYTCFNNFDPPFLFSQALASFSRKLILSAPV